MKKYEELKSIVASLEHDVDKFSRGIMAAGTRLRKGLQAVKKCSQEMRNEIQEVKKKDKEGSAS